MLLSLKFSRENYRHRANVLAFPGRKLALVDPAAAGSAISGTLVKFQPSRIVGVRLTNRCKSARTEIRIAERRGRANLGRTCADLDMLQLLSDAICNGP